MPNLLGVRSKLTNLQRAILVWAIDSKVYFDKGLFSPRDCDVPSHVWLGKAEQVIEQILATKQFRGVNEDAAALLERLQKYVAESKRTRREDAYNV